MKFIYLITLFIIISGCKSNQPVSNNNVERSRDLERLEIMKNEILEMVKIKCKGDSDCKFVPFGSKPCGGPWEFLIYSASSSDENLLLQIVEEYNELEEKINKKHNRISDCSTPAKPELKCESSQCTEIN